MHIADRERQIGRARARLAATHGRIPEDEEIAAALGLTSEQWRGFVAQPVRSQP